MGLLLCGPVAGWGGQLWAAVGIASLLIAKIVSDGEYTLLLLCSPRGTGVFTEDAPIHGDLSLVS